MIITVLGCTNLPVSHTNRVESSSELATGSTMTRAETTVRATASNPRTDIPTNKVGTREGYAAPEFNLPMSDGDTRVFPSSLEKGNPVFLLFFTPH